MNAFLQMLRHDKRPLIADGAIGSRLRATFEPARDRSDSLFPVEQLNVTDPDRVKSLHREYLDAGARAITTNSFCANRALLVDPELRQQVPYINQQAARLARQAVNEIGAGCVLGACGPVDLKDRTRVHYVEQIMALMHGGVDCLLFETVRSSAVIREALAAAAAAFTAAGWSLPIAITYSPVDDSLAPADGSLEDLVALVEDNRVTAFGVNCGDGNSQVYRALSKIRETWSGPLIAIPSAGLPHSTTAGPVYPIDADTWASRVADWQREFSCAIVGGCCGTTPAYIARLAALLRPDEAKRDD